MAIEVVEYPEVTLLGIQEPASVEKMGEIIPRLLDQIFATNPSATFVGGPRVYYWDWTDTGGTAFVAMPVVPGTEPGEGCEVQTLAAGRAARAIHIGSYDGLKDAWMACFPEMEAQGLQMGRDCWEDYIGDPDTTPIEQVQTDIMIQVV